MKWKNRMHLEMFLDFIFGGHPAYFDFGDDIAVSVNGYYAVIFGKNELSTKKMRNIAGELNRYEYDDFARSVKADGERFCVYVKKQFVDIFPDCSFRCVGALSPIFEMYDGKCVGILMPVRPESVEEIK